MTETQPHYPMAPGQQAMNLPLSLSRQAGNTIYISGHGATDQSGAFVGDTFEAQMRYTMELLSRTLAERGLTYADLVMVRGYVQNPSDLPTYNRLYVEYFRPPYPARTTIVNCLPPGLLFEIDAVAELAAEGT